MKVQEDQEVSVIIETDALINPDTVVIELLYTTLAHTAMLRSCRLFYLTSLAFVLLLKYDPIRFEALNSRNALLFVGLLINTSRVHPTCHEVACVAHKHEDRTRDLVIFVNKLIRHFRKSILHIDVETSKRARKIDNLNEWIWLITDPARCIIDEINDSLSTNLLSESSESIWKLLE